MADALAKDNAHWSRHLDARLVRYVQRRRCLWDPTHPQYTVAVRQHLAYSEVACKFGPQYSAEMVKERWSELRATFVAVLRERDSSHLHNPDMPFEPSWHLWKACQFLKKALNEDGTTFTDLRVKMESGSNIDEDALLLLKEEGETDIGHKEENNEAKEAPNCEDIVEGLVTALNSVQSGILGTQNSEYDKLGRIISKKLSKMNSYEAALTSTKIMEILLLYDENNPLNPNNQIDVKDPIEEP